MVWPDGKPEKRSGGKERRRTSRLFSEGLQLRNRTGSMRQQTKEYPARGKDSGGGGGLQGKSRMRSEEHTSELQSRLHLVCRLLLEKKKGTFARHGGQSLQGLWVEGGETLETRQYRRSL